MNAATLSGIAAAHGQQAEKAAIRTPASGPLCGPSAPRPQQLLPDTLPLPAQATGTGSLRAVAFSLLAHSLTMGLVCAMAYTLAPCPLPVDGILHVHVLQAAPAREGAAQPSPHAAFPEKNRTALPATPPPASENAPPRTKTVQREAATKPLVPKHPPQRTPARTSANTPQRDTAASPASTHGHLSSAAPAAGGTPGHPAASGTGATGQGVPVPLGKGVNAPPRYPELARQRGQQGTCTLLAEVDASGHPAVVRVHQSSGHRLLDDAAVAAVRRWRFRPAVRAGQPVAASVLVPVTFYLR